MERIGTKYIYIGQINQDTDKREGVGIMVFDTGNTIEWSKLIKVFMKDIGKTESLMAKEGIRRS